MKVMHSASLFVSNHNARESQSLEAMGSGLLSRLKRGCRWVWVIASGLFLQHQLCCHSWGRTGGSQCLMGGRRGCGLGWGGCLEKLSGWDAPPLRLVESLNCHKVI